MTLYQIIQAVREYRMKPEEAARKILSLNPAS